MRQTVYDLPHESHTYGKKVVDDPEPIKYGTVSITQLLTTGKKQKIAPNLLPKLKISKNSTDKPSITMFTLPKYQ